MDKFNNYTDDIRSSIVGKILNNVIDDITMCRIIEKSIYNYTIKLSNLDPNSYIQNTEFKNKVTSNEIDIDNIANISSYDIYPEIWKELLDNKIKRDKLKYELKPEAMTDVFKCRKCYSRSCSYYEVQTRSADEPKTQFINCLDCGKRWRQ